MPLTSKVIGSKLTHAAIDVHEPGPSPGKLGAKMYSIEFQFNPKELTMAKTAKWEKKNQNKSSSTGPVSYNGAEPQKLSIEMFLDASKAQDDSVVKQVEQLFQACTPTSDSSGKNKPSAPWVQFTWGALSGFVGYIKTVSAKYTLFTLEGTPIRAVCTVSLEELPQEKGKQNPTSGGLLPRRVHILREGDSLPMLAYREYGDATAWRDLAAVNGIDDPMRLRSGQPIFLPTSGELARAETFERARREVARAAH